MKFCFKNKDDIIPINKDTNKEPNNPKKEYFVVLVISSKTLLNIYMVIFTENNKLINCILE